MKLIATTAVLALTLAAGADVRYTVTDLGTMGNFDAIARGISPNGLIVGAANTPATGYDFAVRWSNGGHILTGEGASGATANAVNSSGVIVGFTDSLNLNGFVLDSTGLHNLGNGSVISAAADINDAGVIVGIVQGVSGFQHATRWDKVNGSYVMTPLPELGGFSSRANSVNAHGLIVGEADLPNNFGVPCVWRPGEPAPQQLPIETSSFSEALGVNDAGQVVGYSYTNTGQVAFLWSAATGEVNLGGLGNAYSTARAINNHGEIVGQSYIAGTSATQHAFIWKDGVMTDLNTVIAPGSGWTLWDAQDINDGGRIVGGGVLNGHAHAFVLTPVVCAADMGGPGGAAGADGELDNNDFIAFINSFFAQDPAADVGNAGGVAGGDGHFDNNDFIVFIGEFFAGC